MEIRSTGFEGLLELQPKIFRDQRGFFLESFNHKAFEALGLPTSFCQDNQSFSPSGVIRGLHFQKTPHAQGKLVRVALGRVLDVVVDMRRQSATFGKSYVVELHAERCNMLYIPEGFAHGFSVLEDAIFQYKCTAYYHKESESGIRWNDPELRIDWKVKNPIISEKDEILPSFSEAYTF